MLDKADVDAEGQDRLLRALRDDPLNASAVEAERAMLAYALKLTRAPARMTAADVESLRAVGFDDGAIHDICAVVAYLAFVNRIADGLGVELEDRFAR